MHTSPADLLCVAVHYVKRGSVESDFDLAFMQGEVSVPIVMNAIVEQVSRAAAGQSLMAAAQAADQEAAAAAALAAAFASFDSSVADAAQEAEDKPQGKKIIYEGDSVALAAAGIVTGVSRCTAVHGPCLLRIGIHALGKPIKVCLYVHALGSETYHALQGHLSHLLRCQET